MMTIKGFAQLCGCTAQTLRYYDKVDLLKPMQVDKWSGYRYYGEAQALDYVKIKNLQAADFSIGEIRQLLAQPDDKVYAAFGEKIAAQQDKLRRIRQIQKQYLHEKNNMEKIIRSITQYLMNGCRTPSALTEFGYGEEDYDAVMAEVKDWLESMMHKGKPYDEEVTTLLVNDELITGGEAVAERLASLTQDGFEHKTILLNSDGHPAQAEEAEREIIFEKHGWAHPRDFLDEIPSLAGNQEYLFSFCLTDSALREDLSFGLFMVGVMRLRRGDFLCRGCETEGSDDGQNHFWLYRIK